MKGKFFARIGLISLLLCALLSVVSVHAKTETFKASDSGIHTWTYSGPEQDYYVETRWKWTWHGTYDPDKGLWKGVFQWQEINLSYGEDGKRYTWHNGGKQIINGRSGVYSFSAVWADPWGYREITVYHEANGEVRVDLFKITKEP